MAKSLDAVAALADQSKLEPFDGRDVVRSTIALTNAGDVLSAAMAVDPTAYHHGQEVVVILKGVVDKVRFDQLDPDDEDGALVRVHTIKAGTAVIADESLVKKVSGALNKQTDRIRRALEAVKGIDPLPDPDREGAALGDPDDDEGDPVEPTPIR